jgi:hypothetical protein
VLRYKRQQKTDAAYVRQAALQLFPHLIIDDNGKLNLDRPWLWS